MDDDTEATRMLAATQATTAQPPRERSRRRLEPLQEEPRRRTAGRHPVAAPPARRRSAPPPPRRGSGLKPWLALLLVLALVAGGIAVYQSAQNTVQQGVQLKRDVRGKVQDAVDEAKGLIEDNTR